MGQVEIRMKLKMKVERIGFFEFEVFVTCHKETFYGKWNAIGNTLEYLLLVGCVMCDVSDDFLLMIAEDRKTKTK